MKAFMTLCAFLAGSASAESQHILNRISYDQLAPVMTSPYMMPYNSMYSTPINQISYNNMYSVTPQISYPIAGRLMWKREAEAEPASPYVYKTEVVNPEDGSEYKSEVQVDRNGNGRSYQRVEQKEGPMQLMRDNYLMDRINRDQMRMGQREMNQMRMGQRQMDSRMYSMEGNQMNRDQMRMDQRQMDQMRMIQGQMRMDQRQMDQMRMDQRQMDPMRMDQRQMYSMEGNQMNRDQMRMDQRQMDQMRMGQRHMDQRQMDEIRMDQRQLDSRMYSLEGNQMDRMNMNNQMNRNQMRMNMNNQMNIQGARRMMTKRETSPAFAYTIMTEHPSEMTRNMMKMEELRQAGRMSYRIPSVMGMMRPYQGMYMVRPAVGSNVAVYQNGQTYGFRTMA